MDNKECKEYKEKIYDKYRVIKNFSFAKVGQVFEYDKSCKVWKLVVNEKTDNYQLYQMMNIDYGKLIDLINSGYLVGVDDNINKDNNTKLTNLRNTINKLMDQYKADYEDLMSQYKDGDVMTCVKVEAETVYTNLIKVLNTLKKIADE